MLEWLIIGGGIQGCTLATYLLHYKKTDISSLRIIDPYSKPLSAWKRCTGIIEMPYLRSPSVHHIHPDPYHLRKFAQTKKRWISDPFIFPYDRPSLKLFNQHCESIFMELNLEKCWHKGKAVGLRKRGSHWHVIFGGWYPIRKSSRRVSNGFKPPSILARVGKKTSRSR